MQRDNSSVNLDAASERSMTRNVIDRIYNMSWLKQNSSMQKENTQRFANGQKLISAKKTDEDYFCGTRKEKKKKKRKEEKGKSMEGSKLQQNSLEKKLTDITKIPLNSATDVTVGKNVWSSGTNVANKLFPNVQSVRIDRLAEEEMLSQALAESIASVQLEQFKRSSPEKENRWEALYGDDDDDDGGWDNVRRNMPSSIEKAINNVSCRRKICKDNNKSKNNNTSPKPGILRKCKGNSRTAKSENLDFCFKKRSSMSEEEMGEIRSPRVVAFNESIDVKIASSDSSDDCEKSEYHPIKSDATLRINDSESPNIDKYGRLEGYSERRLFMGKGARMKEQQYLQNKLSSGKVMQTDNVGKSNTDKNIIIKVTSIEKSDQKLKKPLFVGDVKSSVIEDLNHSDLEPSGNNSSADRSLDQSSCAINSSRDSIINCSAPQKSEAETSRKTESKVYALKDVDSADKICDINRKVLNEVSKSTDLGNISKVQCMSSSTQASVSKLSENGTGLNVSRKESTYTQNLQEEHKDRKLESKICYSAGDITESEVQGDKLDCKANYGVWIMMRENPCTTNIPAKNLQYTDSIAAVQNRDSPSPEPYQNSYPERMMGVERNLNPRNLLAQNINCKDMQNQELVAPRDEFLPHENTSINQLWNCNAYPLPINPNVVNEMQRQQLEYAHCMSQIGTQYFPHQNVGPTINSSYYGPLNYVQDGENMILNTPVDNASPMMNKNILLPCDPEMYANQIQAEKTMVRWIKNDKLPPGFGKHRAIRKNDDEDNRLIINSLLVNMSMNNREEVQKTEHIASRNENYCGEKPSRHSSQNNAVYYKRQVNNSSTYAKQQTRKSPIYRYQNQGARRPTSLPIPHPILGASVYRQDTRDKVINMANEREKLNLNGNSESNRDEVSLIMPNPVERMIQNSGISPVYNNNYLIQNRQNRMSESCNNDADLPSTMPTTCHTHHPPGFNNVINWQHKVNMMNPDQLPMNFDPRIQVMQNPIPGSSDVSFTQFQSNMINLGNTTPLYSMPPPNMNANAGHNVQHLQQSNAEFRSNAYHFVEMRQSRESQETARPLLNHYVQAVGRGRGRLTKRES